MRKFQIATNPTTPLAQSFRGGTAVNLWRPKPKVSIPNTPVPDLYGRWLDETFGKGFAQHLQEEPEAAQGEVDEVLQKRLLPQAKTLGTNLDRIANGDPAARARENILWENRDAVVVLDGGAHALVIPKKQMTYPAQDPEVVGRLATVAKSVSEAFSKETGSGPASIWINPPKLLSQRRMHVHVSARGGDFGKDRKGTLDRVKADLANALGPPETPVVEQTRTVPLPVGKPVLDLYKQWLLQTMGPEFLEQMRTQPFAAKRELISYLREQGKELSGLRDNLGRIIRNEPGAREREKILWENDDAIVVMDFGGDAALVVPKKEMTFPSEDPAVVARVAQIAQAVAVAFGTVTGSSAASIYINPPAALTQRQLHVHVEPQARFHRFSDEALRTVSEALAQQLGSSRSPLPTQTGRPSQDQAPWREEALRYEVNQIVQAQVSQAVASWIEALRPEALAKWGQYLEGAELSEYVERLLQEESTKLRAQYFPAAKQEEMRARVYEYLAKNPHYAEQVIARYAARKLQ